jgi:hypothetical protein
VAVAYHITSRSRQALGWMTELRRRKNCVALTA